MGNKVDFIVTSISSSVEAVISPETKVALNEEVAKGVPSNVPRVSYEDIRGLEKYHSKINLKN